MSSIEIIFLDRENSYFYPQPSSVHRYLLISYYVPSIVQACRRKEISRSQMKQERTPPTTHFVATPSGPKGKVV